MTENRIGSERARLRMSQKELAEHFNMSTRTLQRYEQDATNTPIQKLKLFAEFFGCSIDYLIGLSNERL